MIIYLLRSPIAAKGDKVVAHFSDGTSVEGDLLVGADGVYSRLRRRYLPDFNPVDTEGRAIYGNTDKILERFNKVASEWMTIISDENQVHLFLEFINFPSDPGKVSPHLASVKDYVYWVMVSGSSNYPLSDEEFFSLDAEGTAALSRKMTKDWDPSLRAVIEYTTRRDSVCRSYYHHHGAHEMEAHERYFARGRGPCNATHRRVRGEYRSERCPDARGRFEEIWD